MDQLYLRHAESSDHPDIIGVVDEWWGGRKMADMLPRLFFVHFRPTSFVAEHGNEIAGFITGFVSETFPDEAYIHFVGVAPEFRGKGVARTLYERFFVAARAQGCRIVRCVTAPINRASISFHLRMGFVAQEGEEHKAGVPFVEGYDGLGEDRVLFSKSI